ncbi:MAG: hypothetical protein U0903_06725 [Planctomycetales bacterium]
MISNTSHAVGQSDDRQRIPQDHSTPIIKDFLFESPFQDLTKEQRATSLREICESSEKQLSTEKELLEKTLTEIDPLELLSSAAFHCLQRTISPKTDFTSDGPYPQSVIELLNHSACEFRKLITHRSTQTTQRSLSVLNLPVRVSSFRTTSLC